MKLDPEIMIPPDLRRLLRDIQTVHPNPLNARTHSRKQRRALAKIIRNLGFINPIVVDGSGMILAGHGRHDAAQELGMTLIPVIVLSEMTEVQKRAYALADLDRGDLMLAQAFANAGATSSFRHHLDDDRRRRNDHGAARLPDSPPRYSRDRQRQLALREP